MNNRLIWDGANEKLVESDDWSSDGWHLPDGSSWLDEPDSDNWKYANIDQAVAVWHQEINLRVSLA